MLGPKAVICHAEIWLTPLTSKEVEYITTMYWIGGILEHNLDSFTGYPISRVIVVERDEYLYVCVIYYITKQLILPFSRERWGC